MSGALWYGPLLPGGAQQQAATGAYTLTCDAGAFTLTGQDATFAVTRKLSCDAGAFTLTGQDAALNRGFYLAADAGAFTISGQDAALNRGFILACDAGAYTLTGVDATLTYTPASDSVAGGGIGPLEGLPYAKPRKEDIDRLKRLMGFTAAEAKEFIARKPEQARLALAVFELSADPDALIDAVLGQPEALDARIRLQTAADAEAVRKIREWIEDENLTLLLILAGSEW